MKLISDVYFAIKYIAFYAINTGAIARFVINFGKIVSLWPQSEFGGGSKPPGRRLRPQFRGLRIEVLAVSVAGCLGVFVGLAGDARHGDALMCDVNWAVEA